MVYPPQRRYCHAPDEGGVVLLLVVFIITLLAAMTVTLSDTAQNDVRVLQNYRASLQAYWTAQSAIQIIAAALSLNAALNAQVHAPQTMPWHNESRDFQRYILPALSLPIGESNSIIGIPNDPLVPGNPPRPIVDENRKLSIAASSIAQGQPMSPTPAQPRRTGLPVVTGSAGLVTGYGQPGERTNAQQFQRLVLVLTKVVPRDPYAASGPAAGQDRQEFIDNARAAQLAGYIVDWIDSDYNNVDETNLNQAENTCPDDGLPYTSKNAPMDSLEELALVCGFRRLPREIILRLAEHLTVYPLTTNIHTATREVLYAFLAAAGRSDENLYDRLHDPQIQDANLRCADILGQADLCTQGALGDQSNIFQVDVYGVTIDPETGRELARRRIREVIASGAGAAMGGGTGLQPLYYRED